MFIRYNENPCNNRTIDCTVRALSTLLNEEWDQVYLQLCMVGYDMCDMPSSKAVVNRFLKDRGFTRHIPPEKCPDCYTVEDFAKESPEGKYLLCTDSHVVCLIDGNWTDTWDSGKEIILFYWKKGA
jgi:hypothetical protein